LKRAKLDEVFLKKSKEKAKELEGLEDELSPEEKA